MMRKIGRFDAYVPDRDPFEILLNILANFDKDCQFAFDPLQIQRFFYKKKREYPAIFQDVHFTSDPDFPYSEELENALIRLQDSGFVTRPNPTYFYYKIDADLKNNMLDSYIINSEDIKRIAESFNNEFLQNQ